MTTTNNKVEEYDLLINLLMAVSAGVNDSNEGFTPDVARKYINNQAAAIGYALRYLITNGAVLVGNTPESAQPVATYTARVLN